MVRIVHTADLHFDSPFAGLPAALAARRKDEQRQTFTRIIQTVKEISADVLLIAGDLFDSRFISASTISFLRESFSEICETPVLISPGNHDFFSCDSLYKSVNLGHNVYVFQNTLSSFRIKDSFIYGYGFGERFVKESPLHGKLIHVHEGVGVLLMHGDISTESDYNPIRTELLAHSGIHYAALGHVHTHTGFCNAGRTVYAYPGIPECRHFDEPGKGGFICGEISKNTIDLSFVQSSIRENITVHVDITGLTTIESVYNKVEQHLNKSNLYKVVLIGQKDSRLFLDINLMEEVLSAFCMYVKIQDKTAVHIERVPESLLEKMFTERLKDKTDEISMRAFREGLIAFGRHKQ